MDEGQEEEKPSKKKPHVDMESFLLELRKMCPVPDNQEAGGGEEPTLVNPQDANTVLASMEKSVTIFAKNCTFQKELIMATFAAFAHAMHKQDTYIGQVLNITSRTPRNDRGVKRGTQLYNLITTHKMYKLRYLQPKDKHVLPSIGRHYQEIIEYLKGNPEEVKWWTQGQSEPRTIYVDMDEFHKDIPYTDRAWLLIAQK